MSESIAARRSTASTPSPPEAHLPDLRWDVWAAAQQTRARVVAAMQARFPNLGAHVVEDLFDEVCEASALAPGQPNAWPGDAPLEGFLRWRLERRLLNHIERRAARHENLDDLTPVLVTESADPALIVADRDQAQIFARHLAELPEDAQRYVADLQAGLKRAEIVEARGWGPKKIKLLRKRIQVAVLNAREAAAAAVLPLPSVDAWRLFRRLTVKSAAIGDAGAVGSGAAVKVAVAVVLASGVVSAASADDQPQRPGYQSEARAAEQSRESGVTAIDELRRDRLVALRKITTGRRRLESRRAARPQHRVAPRGSSASTEEAVALATARGTSVPTPLAGTGTNEVDRSMQSPGDSPTPAGTASSGSSSPAVAADAEFALP